MSFRVLLAVLAVAAPCVPAAEKASWPEPARIVAVGDVHGDYDQFTAVLKSAGLIDARGNWSGGKAHLVQLGDVPDRGPNTRKVLDLLMRLESQARKAGGRVHALIGNHEAMNLYGDLRYVSPGEYDEFRTPRSEDLREKVFKRALEQRRQDSGALQEDEFRREWMAGHPPGFIEHRLAYGPDGKYGKWIRNNNAVVRVGRTLFVHGGISPAHAALSLEEINARVREELSLTLPSENGLVRGEDGPLWYRGLAQAPEPELERHVATVLNAFEVERIVVGHTTTGGMVLPRFGGQVILADVGLSRVYGGPAACLVIENGTAYALHGGAKVPLPGGGGDSLARYLREIAAHSAESRTGVPLKGAGTAAGQAH